MEGKKGPIQLGRASGLIEDLLVRWCPLFSAAVILGVSALAENEPTAAQLIDTILREPLSTTSPKVKSYEAEMEVGGLRMIFRYAQPYGSAVQVVDSRDGVPVFFATGGQMAFYDTLASSVLLVTNQYVKVRIHGKFSPEPGQSGIFLDLGMTGDPKQMEGRVEFARKFKPPNLQAEIRNLGGEKYELKCIIPRPNQSTGKPTDLKGGAVVDWPSGELPYHSLHVEVEGLMRFHVRSVNQQIPESSFRFPLEALTQSGLPIQRISLEDSDQVIQVIGIVGPNVSVRRILGLSDPQNAREEFRKICQKAIAISQDNQVKRAMTDPAAVEAMLSKMSPEEWEGTRAQYYADLSKKDFDSRRQNPVFRAELAKMIAADMGKPLDGEKGVGASAADWVQALTKSYVRVAASIDQLDLEALRAKDQEIADQLRKVFALEAGLNKH